VCSDSRTAIAAALLLGSRSRVDHVAHLGGLLYGAACLTLEFDPGSVVMIKMIMGWYMEAWNLYSSLGVLLGTSVDSIH
jgi:hypothetical protein